MATEFVNIAAATIGSIEVTIRCRFSYGTITIAPENLSVNLLQVGLRCASGHRPDQALFAKRPTGLKSGQTPSSPNPIKDGFRPIRVTILRAEAE